MVYPVNTGASTNSWLSRMVGQCALSKFACLKLEGVLDAPDSGTPS